VSLIKVQNNNNLILKKFKTTLKLRKKKFENLINKSNLNLVLLSLK